MTEPIHIAVTTDAAQAVRTAEAAFTGFLGTLKTLQGQFAAASGAGGVGYGVLDSMTRQYEGAAQRFHALAGDVEKRATKTLAKAGKGGKKVVADQFRFDAEIQKLATGMFAEAAVITQTGIAAAKRTGLDPGKAVALGRSMSTQLDQLVVEQLRDRIGNVKSAKLAAGSPAGLTGLGEYYTTPAASAARVASGTRPVSPADPYFAGRGVTGGALAAVTQQHVTAGKMFDKHQQEAVQHQAEVAAATKAHAEVQRRVLRDIRENYAHEGRLRRPHGAELLTGPMARALDPGIVDPTTGLPTVGSQVRKQLHVDKSGAVYGRPVSFLPGEKDGTGRYVEEIDKGLIKLADSRLAALQQARVDPADYEAGRQKLERHLARNVANQVATYEQKQVAALEAADAKSLRTQLDRAVSDGRAVRSGGRIIDQGTGQVYDAPELGTRRDRASLVTGVEANQRALVKSAKEQEKYAADLHKTANSSKATAAQQLEAQAALGAAQRQAARSADLASRAYGPMALAGSQPPPPPRAPSLAFSAGKGGDGGGGGSFREAMFGAGPGGSGGGLFTKDRLLRQGVSFGGYMISAAAIGGLMGVIGDTINEAKRFGDAMTDLDVAMGELASPSSRLISDLSEISRLAGENVSVAMETAARGMRAFGRGITDEAGLDEIGVAFARVTAQLAVVADKGLEDAAGDVIAVGRAYDIAATSLSQFLDAVAVAKQLGGSPNAIAQGTASFAQIASEAGFSLQQTSSLVSAVQAQTDLAPRAVAQQLQRILSTLGGTAGRSVIQDVNKQVAPELQIDPNGALSEQLLGLAAAQDSLTESSRDLIVNQVGGRSAATALVAVFDSYEAVLENVESAEGKAGQGQAEFNRRLESFAGLLRQLVGLFTNIQTGLVNAGIFDIFGIALEFGLKPMLKVANSLLDVFNMIPPSLRKTGVILAEIALVMRTIERSAGLAAMFGHYGRKGGGGTGVNVGGFAAATGLARLGQPLPRPSVSGAYHAVGGAMTGASLKGQLAARNAMTSLEVGAYGLGAKLNGARASVNAFGTSVAGFTTLVLGGMLLIKAAWDASKDAIGQADSGRDALAITDPGGTMARRNLADALEVSAVETRGRGITGAIGKLLYGTGELADALDARAARLIASAERIEEMTRQAGVSDAPEDVFDFSQIDAVSVGLDVLASSGRSAETQLDALITAFEELGTSAGDAAFALSPLEAVDAGTRVATGLTQRLGFITGEMQTQAYGDSLLDMSWIDEEERLLYDQARVLTEVREQFATRMGEALERGVVDSGGTVTPSMEDEFVTLGMNVLADEFRARGVEFGEHSAAILEQQVRGAVDGALQGFRPSDEAVMSAQIQSFLNEATQLVSVAQQDINTMLSLENGAGDAAALKSAEYAKAQIDRIEAAAKAAGALAPELEQFAIAKATVQLALLEAEDRNIDALTDAAVANLYAGDEIGKLAAQLEGVVAKLALSDAPERVAELMRQKQAILNQLASENVRLLNAVNISQANPADRVLLEQKLTQNAKRDVELIEELGGAGTADHADAITSLKNQRYSAQQAAESASKAAAKSAEELRSEAAALAIARRNALVAAESPLAQAHADVLGAMDNLGAQARGSAGYYDALTQLNQAKHALAQQEMALSNNRALLGIDGTNPLERARVGVEQARSRLARDIRRGADELVVTGSELALEDAIASAEQTYFNQRLSRLRTDLDLGKVTRAQYLNGLEQLANELRAVEDRSFQQQELLDQIDLAIKSAASSASGQFNLGDIDVPTPYEARRAASRAMQPGYTSFAGGQVAVVDNRDITVIVNGGNSEEVRREIQRALGSSRGVSPTMTGGRI